MLPQVRGLFRLVAAILAAAGVLGGCGPGGTPDAQVRGVIAAGEAAAERRDLAGILEHVSPAFRDRDGGDRDDLRQYLRGYLMTHQSVHLVTRIERVEFPYRDYARAEIKVGMLGRDATGTDSLELAADVQDVVLELQLEDDAWRVVRAAWQSTRRD